MGMNDLLKILLHIVTKEPRSEATHLPPLRCWFCEITNHHTVLFNKTNVPGRKLMYVGSPDNLSSQVMVQSPRDYTLLFLISFDIEIHQ